MNPKFNKFAPAGLYLSLAAAVASLGLYIVYRSWNLALQISLGLIIVGLALTIILDPQRAREFLTGRQARYGSNAFVMAVAVIGILVVINYLGNSNSKRWDLTANKEHTLAPETIDTLASLKQPVEAEAFYTVRMSQDSAKKLLDSYQYNSKGNFTYRFIDPEANPVAAQQAKITRDGTIVLKQGDHQEQVTSVGEEDLTSALIRLANPGKRAVYFLTGHGEFDLGATSDRGSYQQVEQSLSAKNYTVNTLNLLSQPTIPEDALAIIIAGAQKPLASNEVDLLRAYLNKGGGLVVLSEPTLSEQAPESDPLADFLAKDWHIQLGSDLVIDPNINPPVAAVADKYGDHVITNKMKGLVTIFPTARSVEFTKDMPDANTHVNLIQTSARSWAETSYDELKSNQVKPDEGKDLMGPVTIALVENNPDTKGRVAVFGDSEFASTQYFAQYGNSDMIINTIDWAAQQENLINLTPKQQVQRTLIPPQQASLGLILLATVFLIPGAAIVAGITVWLQRKRRG